MRLLRTTLMIVTAAGLAIGLQAPTALAAPPSPGAPCSVAEVNRTVKTAKGWLGCVRPASVLEFNVGGLTPAEKQAALAANSGPGIWELIGAQRPGKVTYDFKLPERLASLDPCRLPEPADRLTSLAVPQPARHPRAIGEFGVTFVPVSFPASATTPASTGDVSVLTRIVPEIGMTPMDAFTGKLTTQSRRRLRVIPEIITTPVVAPQPASAYGLTRGEVTRAADLVTVLGPQIDAVVNARLTKAVVLVANDPVANYSWAWPAYTSIPADGGTLQDFVFLNAASTPWLLGAVLSHEMLHILGLTDVYRTDQSTNRGAGRMTMMGYTATLSALTEYERWSLGWLDDGRVACLPVSLPQPQRFTLDAAGSWLKTPGAKNLVLIRLDQYWNLAIEYRGRDGGDQYARTQDGVHVYLVDSGASNRTSNPITSNRSDRTTLDAMALDATAEAATQRYAATADNIEASLVPSGGSVTYLVYRIAVGRTTARTAEVTVSR